MSEILITIHNAETNEITQRPATQDELAQMEKDKLEAETLKAEAETKVAARQAILDRLGLTEEEAKLLLS